MFKNFKLSQCTNFLYAAYTWLGLAGAAVIYLIGRAIDLTPVFFQGVSFAFNTAVVVAMIASGVMWLDEGLASVQKLMREKNLFDDNKYKDLWEEIYGAASVLTLLAVMFAVLMVVVLVMMTAVWLTKL